MNVEDLLPPPAGTRFVVRDTENEVKRVAINAPQVQGDVGTLVYSRFGVQPDVLVQCVRDALLTGGGYATLDGTNRVDPAQVRLTGKARTL